jgi:hypothetical protein
MLSSMPFIAPLPDELASKTASLVTVHGRYGNNALNGDWELGLTSNTSAPPQRQLNRTWNSGTSVPFTFTFTNTRSDAFTNLLDASFSIGGTSVQFDYGSQFASYEPNAIKIWARTSTADSGVTINDLQITTPGVSGTTMFPGTAIAVSQASGTVFQEIIIAGIDFQSMSGGTVTLQGNVAMQFDKNSAPRGSSLQFHVIAAHIPWVDLDVNSNNEGGIDPRNGRSGTDDRIEQAAPGVIIPVGGERAEMLITLPVGRNATLELSSTAADKVRVHEDRVQNTPLPFIPATLNTPATLDLSLVRPTNSTGTLNTWQLWIQALAPSTTAGDIVFTLTGDSSGLPASDIVRATAVEANLVAHRTGGRPGEPASPVSEDLESAGDPNTYMILTNRDFEQGLPLAGRDFDDAIALLPPLLGPEGQADDDLAKITLKRLPSGLNSGSVRLSVSHPDAVRLFKAVPGSMYGTALSPGEWTASLRGSGYLADLKSRDVDIWLEGLKKVEDFKFTMEYVAPSGLKTSDDVHMLIADWTFRGSDGYEVPFVSPVWLDALLAATDSPKTPLADPTGAFYKIHIDGLAPWLVTQLIVASDSTTDFYTESYAGGDFDTAYSNATVSRRFGVLHSAEHVLDAPKAPAVTPDDQRERIRDTLDLNVVHNDGLTATVVTPWDIQSDRLKKHGRFEWSLTEKPEGIYKVADTIRGSVAWPEKMFPVVYGAITESRVS